MKIVNSSFIYLGLLALTFLYGCAKNEVADPPLKESSTTKNRFFLTQGEAIKLVAGDALALLNRNARTSEGDEKIIKDVRSFYNEDGAIVFYIVNYEDDKGFTLLSADRRMKPILAFSDQGTFDEKTDNPGIQLWFDIIKENFKGAQRQTEAHIDIVNYWKQLEQNPDGGKTSDQPIYTAEESCEWFVTHPIPANLTIQHLTHSLTRWRQQTGYNAFCPAGLSALNCKGDYSCSKAPTGCGPVAVGQVLRYHHKPVTANGHAYSSNMFTGMPIAAPELCVPVDANHINLAQLLRDVGKDLDAVYNTIVPALGIPMSGAGCQTWNIPGHIDNFFSNRGYTSFDKEFFTNSGIINAELRASRPVIVFGSNCAACASNQHIWIMDGIKDLYAIFNDQNGFCYENHAIYYQMNWGWGNIAENNTWFAYTGIVCGGILYNSSNMRAYIVQP
ncbi:C10 family peptidase [Dyadobacter sp. CY107]|uniref:C10 family peptidase n=1 Tax=Dyadobacter fanqingshengii TaxID=2906443 RepID=UPI001F3702E7|nr:C10 family peptidase [Dyadobacter fanqingshengii]MCF2502287.1 C10 family peptidase [Dyadobacter fanqingshengii]